MIIGILVIIFCLVYFGQLLPQQKEIDEYIEIQKLKSLMVEDLKGKKPEMKEIENELEYLEEKLEEIKGFFPRQYGHFQEIKNFLQKRAIKRGVREESFDLQKSGANGIFSGTWEGEFSALMGFLQDFAKIPYRTQLKEISFQAGEELFLKVMLKSKLEEGFFESGFRGE